jgi:hypothetical protein
MSQKSVLEQALLQVNTLEEAVKQNAKGILSSVMKQELNDLLKEQAEDEEQPIVPDEEEQDVTGDEPGDEETSISDETADDTDSEDEEGMPSLDDEASDDEMADEPADDDSEDVLDMTSASDEEVLKVFKAMKPEDGIVVKKDGDTISFSDEDDEYIIKLDHEESEEEEEENSDFSMDDINESDVDTSMLEGDDEGDDEEGDETIYEITLDEEEPEINPDELSEEDDDMEEPSKEVEATEAARTFANDARKPATQGKKYKAGRHEMNEEVEKLKKQNSEYKKALILFKDKLNEVAVFNANLAYATRLFTEHSTTKNEKLNILKRFDTISTIKESKNLYSSIKSELDTKKPMTESVVEKLISTPTTSSTEVLSEAKAYENPQFRRMKDLMSKIK